VQTVHPSLNSIAQSHAKDVMNICSSQEEFSVKLVRAAATDENACGGGEVRESRRVCGAVGATFEQSIQGG
jgi:hypothetical protein